MEDTRIVVNCGQVNTNFEEVEKYILETLKEYEGAVFVGDESIKMAKSIVAGLRKDQKALKDDILEHKREYMKPWNEFEARAKEILALYDEPITLIDGQVKEFAEKQKEEKRKVIEEIYKGIFNPEDGLTLESIYNTKWENVTTTKKAITDEMQEIKRSFDADMQTLLAFMSDAVDKAVEMYMKDRNLQSAIAYITHYENQKNEILQKQRDAEEERIRREEREKIEAELRAEQELTKAVEKAKEEVLENLIPEDMDGEAQDFIYSINLIEAQRDALETYMSSIGIDWEVLA